MTEAMRAELNALAEVSLEEVTGLMEYLQSPEALKNARRGSRTPNRIAPKPRTRNPEPRSPNPEPRTKNQEPNVNTNREP